MHPRHLRVLCLRRLASMSLLSARPLFVGWTTGVDCGAGDNLGAGLLYQTEYRSEQKLSKSTKSDVVRLGVKWCNGVMIFFC